MEWKEFLFNEIFNIEKGFYNNKPKGSGNLPFISATKENNGISDYLDKNNVKKTHKGNCLTVVNDGNSMGETFYQENEFTSSHSINVLRLKNITLNKYIAMFLILLIRNENYRFNYGRKWRIERMRYTKIKLPILKNGSPNWQFMEDYIKSLPYSSNL